MNKFFRGLSLWLIIIAGAWLMSTYIGQGGATRTVSYSEFKSLLKQGQITSAIIRTNMIRGEYEQEGKAVKYKVVSVNDPKLIEELESYNVPEYRGESDRTLFSNFLWYFGPVILFALLWFFMIKQMQGGGKQAMSFGKSKARLQTDKEKKITFKDVAGCDESKEELEEIIEFLKNPKKFQVLGGKIPKGVLLYGAPGTGKTLLAKAVAGEANVPFFSCSGSEFVEMFVGVGASRVRDLFDKGKKNAPCLLFVDEIDAVGRHRFAGIGGGHDEREQTLNQILVEMDGFDTKEGVILIAATNRPDVLDPALLRPGRFDRHIAVPSPDLKGREEILKVHTRDIKLAEQVDLSVLARRTPGFVGSDLANLCNEGALLAARKNKKAVEMDDLENAIDRVIAGPERRSRMISEREKKIVAYHECGHAFVAKMIPGADPVHKISIIPRGPALGYTLQLPTEDKYLTSRKDMIDKITVFLGGRVAEETFCDDITSGAQDDLNKATQLAQKMVCEFGMSKKLGPLTYKKPEEEVFLGRDISRTREYSNKTLEAIDQEIKNEIDDAYERAKKYISENKEAIQKMVDRLIEREVIEGEELDELIAGIDNGEAKNTKKKNMENNDGK
ncbi:MAG: ATP-dependent zinc metalloprotease FtsH [Elusimicrobiota bacterium]